MVALIGVCGAAPAQLVGGDAFLQGNFAEAGVGSDAVFGSDSAPPSGFHPRGGGGLLGYVADDDKDGFSTDFDGDFFLPGTPEESFTVRVGGSNFTNANGSTPQVPGSLSNFVDNGFRQSVDWEGTINGLSIEKTYSVFSDSIALQVQMTLTNTTSSTMTDVYYLRNVDPDNNQSLHGDFATTNTVISQGNDGSGRAQVEATQNVVDNGSKLVLSGEGTNARATYGGFSNRDPVAVWNGDSPFSQSGTNTADEAISLAYKFDSIAPNESVTVNWSYQLADFAPPSLDLDADDSSGATGSAFQVDFLGSAVAVADSDVSITDPDSTEISFAEILITDDQAGDSLSVSGTLPAGISVDGSSTATELFLTGNASLADYETALTQIRFDNSSGSLGGDDRSVAVTVLDSESNPSGTANATIVARKPDLTVTKVDSADPVVAGDQFSYTITVDNSGTGDASDVVVSDTLPAELSFVSSSGCNNDPGGFPDCQLGDLAASGNVSYTLVVEADSGAPVGTVTNQVSVSSSSQETDASNNSGSESTELLDGSPSFDNGGSTSIATDEEISVAINSILSASDPNTGQTLTWSVASPPSNGSLLGFDATETSNGGSVTPSGLSYQPAGDFFGTDGFTIRVSDGTNTADISVSVTVNAVNDAPSFAASNPPAVDEGAGLQTISGWSLFDPGPSNESGQGVQAYTVTNVSDPGLFAAGPSVSTGGDLSYTPATEAHGTASFDVTVQDDGGTTNGGNDTSAPQTFTITVNPVNDQPSFTASSPPAVDEDAGAQSVTGWAAFDPGPNESGQSVQAYLVSNVSDPGLFAAGPTVSPGGELTYTPATHANGTATFDVAV